MKERLNSELLYFDDQTSGITQLDTLEENRRPFRRKILIIEFIDFRKLVAVKDSKYVQENFHRRLYERFMEIVFFKSALR
jgi:hypothetical protein